MTRNMADSNMMDCTNESDLNAKHILNMRHLIGQKKKVGKRGKLRVLYSHKESVDSEDNDEILSEPASKKIRLPSTSCTAAIGDGSHIDPRFDVVDITRGISRTQALPFQSWLNKSTFISGRNLKDVPKPMQQRKTVCDLFNNNNMEGLSSTLGSSKTHADGQNAANMVDNRMFGRSESRSTSVSGITRLQVTNISAMSHKSRIPATSVRGNLSDITNRMCTTEAETTDYNKLTQLVQIPELTRTSRRAKQAASTHKPQHLNEEEDELPATQPEPSRLLKGIVAYVDYRPGGENLSVAIGVYMSSLGATVRDKFTNDVTHVVFGDGLWSTYKKAVEKKVHMVRATWIEECKKAQTIVSEGLFPPFDMEMYESPHLCKRSRKVRSLQQPNFEDMGEKKIKKRRKKKPVHNVNENEPQIELPDVPTHKTPMKVPDVPTHKTPIKVPEFLRTISKENSFVRTLLSVAEIGPEFEDYVKRPDSPTMSDDEYYTIPLAVRLLRTFLKPQPSSELASSGVATTSAADIAETSGAVGNIISENSKCKSSDCAEFSNSNIDVHKNRPVDTETLATGMCSSQSINKEDQFPNISTSIRVGKGTSLTKRKLFSLPQCDSPEVLNTNVSTVTDEISHLSLQCPYIKEQKNVGGKKKKSLHPVGEISVKTFSGCPPSTSSSTKWKGRHGEEGETVSKVPCSSGRGSVEFVRIAKQPTEKKDKPRKMLRKNLPSLVCTGLHKREVEVVTSVVKKLGGFIIEANVSEKTTHVVTQGPRSTVNLLKGIARGCWIVLQEWVLKSLDADAWLEEDEFELTGFSPAVRHCRMQKQSFGPVYNLDLFSTCGYICVSRDSVPPKRDLEELITLCGGRIGPSLRASCILVAKAPSERYKHIKCVNEQWVLDSIQFNTLKPLSEYAVL